MRAPLMTGTRQLTGFRKGHPPTETFDRTLTRDVGLNKNVTASITFVAATTSQLQAANGTFANFAVGDPIMVEGTNLNNGKFTVTGIDGTNQSYLTVDVPPKNEGPVNATVRTV